MTHFFVGRFFSTGLRTSYFSLLFPMVFPWTKRNWILALGLLCACDSGQDNPTPVIWFAAPSYGEMSAIAAQDEIDSLGLAVAIRFVPGETDDSPEANSNFASRIAADPGISGVVGHIGSTGSLVAAPFYEDVGLPMIVPTGTSRLLGEAGSVVFPLAPNDSIQAAFIAAYADTNLHAASATIFFQGDDYGSGLRSSLVKELGARGIVVVDEVIVRLQRLVGRDLVSLVQASFQRGIPEVVILATDDPAATRIMQWAARLSPGISFVAGDGVIFRHPPPSDSVAKLAVVDYWDPGSTTTNSLALKVRFLRLFGRLPIGGEVMRHDALMLMAHAAAEVGPDRREILHYLRTLGDDKPTYTGVTGELSFVEGRASSLVMRVYPSSDGD